MQRSGGSPSWDIRVQDGVPGTSPYTFIDGTDFNSSAGTARAVDIPTGISATGAATGTRASAPFAILDTIYTAMQTDPGRTANANFPTLDRRLGRAELTALSFPAAAASTSPC